MREIKFRAKRVKPINDEVWIYGDLVKMSIIDPFTYIAKGIGYKAYDVEIGKSIKVLPHTVGQYTGLKGKNGVEIYEGDIVITHPNRSPLPIVWNDEVARFNIGSFRIEHGEVVNLEVIGNIYENKDLLK